MKIKIIRKPIGKQYSGHLYFYAWTDTHNDKYKNHKCILFNFPAPQTIKLCKTLPKQADSHNAVILSSDVSFSRFCKIMAASEFKSSDNYELIGTNCVDSIIKALQVAQINVDIDKSCKLKHTFSCFVIPTTLSAPREIISALKKYKRDNTYPTSNILNENEFQQWQLILAMESAAIRDERLSMIAYIFITFLLLSAMAGSLSMALNITVPDTNYLLYGSVVTGVSAVGLFGCCALKNVLLSRADRKGKLIEGKYMELPASQV